MDACLNVGPGAGFQQCYAIVSKLHGLVLDVERSEKHPGARVAPYNRNGGENQQWYDDSATGTIRSKLNGFCLDIEGNITCSTLIQLQYQGLSFVFAF